jgi:hypothetical protein
MKDAREGEPARGSLGEEIVTRSPLRGSLGWKR